jgi:hypothetical protein
MVTEIPQVNATQPKRASWSSEMIQGHIRKVVGTELSPDFTKQLRLKSQEWTIYPTESKKNPSSALLLLGETQKKHLIKRANKTARLTTVISIINKSDSNPHKINSPHLRITKIDEKQKKVITTTYDGNGEAIELKTSLTREEYVQFAHSPDSYLLEPIEHVNVNRHDAVELATSSMQQATHSEAKLVFSFYKGLPPPKRFGCDVAIKEHEVVVKFGRKAAKKKGLKHWKIHTPRTFK